LETVDSGFHKIIGYSHNHLEIVDNHLETVDNVDHRALKDRKVNLVCGDHLDHVD
tara:strand:+ start:374 stop:538 length:165 start_codon:yes stop_codon:yes gene_type:complete